MKNDKMTESFRPVTDEFEACRNHRKHLDSDKRPLLQKYLNQYGTFRQIMRQIENSPLRPTQYWSCVRLQESLWSNVREFLDEYGYDDDWIYAKNGRVGLRGYPYNDGIPCQYDEILLTYDGNEQLEYPVAVRLNEKCGLVKADGIGTVVCPFEYDLLFREPFTDEVRYIACKDGKYGIINIAGKEEVPCVMDCIYKSVFPNSPMPLLKDGKWGIYYGSRQVQPEYDELLITDDKHIRVRLGNQWGWISFEGEFTTEAEEYY